MADVDAPTSAQQAAEREYELKAAGQSILDEYNLRSRAAALAEWLYRKAEAMGEPRVKHGRDAAARKRLLLDLPLSDYFVDWAVKIAEMAEVEPPEGTFDTVGELRWLRDTTKSVAQGAYKRASYHESEVKYATSVVAWARREYEQVMGGAA